MRLLGCLVLLGLLLGAVPRPAGASPLVYSYTGSILSITEELAAEGLPFGVNDPVRLTLIIDDGAARALNAGKSLLPAGVTAVDGSFDRGDAVSVRNTAGHELARGLTAYAAADALRIIGRRSSEIAEILGYHGREEMIHRDDLALF